MKTSDGLRLAWAEAGQGRAMVKAAHWLTHLEHDWNSPVWRHWNRFEPPLLLIAVGVAAALMIVDVVTP